MEIVEAAAAAAVSFQYQSVHGAQVGSSASFGGQQSAFTFQAI